MDLSVQDIYSKFIELAMLQGLQFTQKYHYNHFVLFIFKLRVNLTEKQFCFTFSELETIEVLHQRTHVNGKVE